MKRKLKFDANCLMYSQYCWVFLMLLWKFHTPLLIESAYLILALSEKHNISIAYVIDTLSIEAVILMLSKCFLAIGNL